MGTWIPLALPNLVQQQWLPQDDDANLTEHIVTQLENALYTRRKQALHHDAPLPMGACINPSALNQHNGNSPLQDAHDDDDDDDAMLDHASEQDEDVMSDSDFADMSEHDDHSQSDLTAAHADHRHQVEQHDDADGVNDDDDDDDDDDIARFL